MKNKILFLYREKERGGNIYMNLGVQLCFSSYGMKTGHLFLFFFLGSGGVGDWIYKRRGWTLV